VVAVSGVSIHVDPGETVGLVGESGSGKSTVGRLALGLLKPDAGSVFYRGDDILSMKPDKRMLMRRRLSAVFQDPNSSLDPRMKVGDSLAEPLKIHGLWNGDGEARVEDMLSRVGLQAGAAARFPHEFSGGQRQRLAIARALMLDPEMVICDEPVSSLDPSVQAQVINLLLEQKRALGLAYLFISHDLGVVRHVSDRIAVLYSGRLVECGPAREFDGGGMHPYTRLLFGSVPGGARAGGVDALPFEGIAGEGCPFRPRCVSAAGECGAGFPPEILASPGHMVACHKVAA
jgi:oligopeptide/dipeptide ABC transporter ATP-binding protein